MLFSALTFLQNLSFCWFMHFICLWSLGCFPFTHCSTKGTDSPKWPDPCRLSLLRERCITVQPNDITPRIDECEQIKWRNKNKLQPLLQFHSKGRGNNNSSSSETSFVLSLCGAIFLHVPLGLNQELLWVCKRAFSTNQVTADQPLH